MSFFDFLKGNTRDITQPQLKVEKINYGSPVNPNRDEDMLLAKLLEKEKLLSSSVEAYKNEEERQKNLPETNNQKEYLERNNRLGSLTTPINKYIQLLLQQKKQTLKNNTP